jgi:glycosyltransferase involved in cell wall biosynthesis
MRYGKDDKPEKMTQTSPPAPSGRAGVVFTMRYPDDTGFVWNYIAGVRDLAGSHLSDQAVPYIAFPKLTGRPSYEPRHLVPVELDCYANTEAGREAIAQFVRAHNVKVMVFMSALPQTVCLDLLRKLGVRTLNTEDDGFDPLRRDGPAKRGIKYLLRRVLRRQRHDLHLANSAAQQQFLLSYQLLPPERVVLMKNSIDCARFSPGARDEARHRTSLATDCFWLLAVSQARPEKRVDWMLRVVQAIAHTRPGRRIGFVYVGDGGELAGWKRLAEELGIADLCVFAGQHNDVLPYYRAADLMLHASVRESFGLAIVEAMSCGLPVVASAAAGPRETIVDGYTGTLVDLHDFDAFANAVLRYVDDMPLTKLHGTNARAHVDSTYNLAQHGREFASHIARFL